MKDSVERMLSALGEATWDEPEACKRTATFWYGMMWISPAV